ncbi:glycosyltransferase [bacterium]|nr:glycosyltransferase [bacterium]
MKVSVIITSYNYEQYIKDVIKSVLNQTFTDFELIIIDDCSSDNSAEIIKSFNDDRIKFIQNDKNYGLKYSVKKAVETAQGEWIAFLESDDLWVSNNLETRLKYAEKYPDVGIIFNDVEEFGDRKWIEAVKNNFTRTRKILNKMNFPKNIFYDINIYNLIMTFSSVMIKREFFENLNFDTPIDALLDWWIYIHVSYQTKAFYIKEKLTKWRQHKQSYIFRKKKTKFKSAQIEAYIDIYKHNNLNPLTFLPFLVFSVFLMLLHRLKFYSIVLIRKIKDILRIKKRQSPLFDD